MSSWGRWTDPKAVHEPVPNVGLKVWALTSEPVDDSRARAAANITGDEGTRRMEFSLGKSKGLARDLDPQTLAALEEPASLDAFHSFHRAFAPGPNRRPSFSPSLARARVFSVAPNVTIATGDIWGAGHLRLSRFIVKSFTP
jgi:hypothetical protein